MLKLVSFVSSHNLTPLSNFIAGIQFQSAFTVKATPTNHFFHLARVFSSISHSQSKMEADSYMFGPYKIDKKEVFYSTDLSYALVNLRPLLPGHVLVCPRREVKRFADLTADETSDLWLTAQKVGKQLESYHKASSLTFAIQDGPQAGQTVPHVHVHIIPRKSGDFEKNDEIYDALDVKEKEMKQSLDLDKERKDRSIEEMAEEADEYRKLF
ncbi:PREDICTED: bifunctional bis(5'-adenosyl)-triphosphatase/adenylylsulfatase FHIT [Nicotiana attenuata]|uniref:bifunctional bis(5'-adenosyl)-triphosphatase/adenylylsulfatase FHIT n=1 Tax=Nicotiana attenuata TaxID=49451 RepID=UPI00090468F3|nr:PREDICTED: bifunctional bis(5'-adenosyl)-triphosphatase/adenylylsulfatase FHIT [Nicotiana attenuata]